MYLSEYLKCLIQYVGMSQTEFNIRLNNHIEDAARKDSIPASNHFALKDIILIHMRNLY